MRNFLVTGGCGFIGSHLCEALMAAGHKVRVLDDLSSGFLANLPPGVDFWKGDVADAVTVAAALEGIDGCFHLAAIASVEKGVQDWIGTHGVNLTATINLFNQIRIGGRRIPVVYASSAAVYGDCPTLPITEQVEKRPLSAYGADKYGCELHARVATHGFAIPTIGLRFFNVYGPRQDPKSPYSGVISIFCDRLRRGESARVFGDGLQSRDFIYVTDVVAALEDAMRLCADVTMKRPRFDAQVFNVCTGQATTVLQLAGTIADLCANGVAIQHGPPRAGEVRHSIGSPDHARSFLALPPPVMLRDGLARVLAWLDHTA